jgi:hypothetical protein
MKQGGLSARRIRAGLAAALLACGPVSAHHSYAMFDFRQSLTLNGVVREFQWTNPHCFLQVVVTEQGANREWSVEMSAPADIYRKGWRPGSLKPGDRVAVTIHPDRDGSSGGTYVSALGPDGKPMFPDPTPTPPPSPSS